MAGGISAAIRLAASDPRIVTHKDQFDTHDHLLNCVNGVVDLYTGERKIHDPNLYLSQLCPTEYIPGATHSVWTGVLEAVTRNHSDLAPFLQRFAGYVAQGNKCEELVVIFYGPGGTGKGTFLGAIEKTLGQDFVRNVAAASLLRQDRSGGGASGDLARLEGARLAIVSEFNRSAKLNAGLVKLISGNDTMVARQLYEREREFTSKFQLVFQTNQRPKFDGADTGNQRRYIEVPFDNVVAKDTNVKVDTGLKKQLASDKNLQQAVLAWIVSGCQKWTEDHGLQLPDCVKAATAELRRTNDILDGFFSDCLMLDPGAEVPVKVMRDAYTSYCEENGMEPVSNPTFNDMLRERGLVQPSSAKRIGGKLARFWRGARLRKAEDPPIPDGL
jgi:putative DNA primase/helicase